MYSVVCSATSWLFSNSEFMKFYQDELRSDFFNGFLSLAGFMLAAKTFIVIQMKQEVYDKPEYQQRYEERKRLTGDSSATKYGPLKNMSNALFWIVTSSVIAAISQVTIGLIPWNIAGIICVTAILFAIISLIYGLILMKQNLDGWFDTLTEEDVSKENSPLSKDE